MYHPKLTTKIWLWRKLLRLSSWMQRLVFCFVSTKESEKNYSLHFWNVQKMEAADFGEMYVHSRQECLNNSLLWQPKISSPVSIISSCYLNVSYNSISQPYVMVKGSLFGSSRFQLPVRKRTCLSEVFVMLLTVSPSRYVPRHFFN
jgi:hypothetical protein